MSRSLFLSILSLRSVCLSVCVIFLSLSLHLRMCVFFSVYTVCFLFLLLLIGDFLVLLPCFVLGVITLRLTGIRDRYKWASVQVNPRPVAIPSLFFFYFPLHAHVSLFWLSLNDLEIKSGMTGTQGLKNCKVQRGRREVGGKNSCFHRSQLRLRIKFTAISNPPFGCNR